MESPVVALHRTRRKSLLGSAWAALSHRQHSTVDKDTTQFPSQHARRPRTRSSNPDRQSRVFSRVGKTSSIDTFTIPMAADTSQSTSMPGGANEPLLHDFQYSASVRRDSSLPQYGSTSAPRGFSVPRTTSINTEPDFSGFVDSKDPPLRVDTGRSRSIGAASPTSSASGTLSQTSPPRDVRRDPGSSLRRRSFKTLDLTHDARISAHQTAQGRTARSTGQRSRGDDGSVPTTPDGHGLGPGDRSSTESVFSKGTVATSIYTLPPLQSKPVDDAEVQGLDPVADDDPRSFDLVAPLPHPHVGQGVYALETRADLLESAEHLHAIFSDQMLLAKFTSFLNSHRPQSIPLLVYYLDALKALRAIAYSNVVAEALEPIAGHNFSQQPAARTVNTLLQEKADMAFKMLVTDDLPAFVAHTWIQLVSISIQRRVTGTLTPHLRDASDGLAEVFCLSDPSRHDNPIIFASEEFARTTRYGLNYAIGRNCRFLQGPRTNRNTVKRLAEACIQGKETTQAFVNYRRDGTPFMNLLMVAPLMDSKGQVRYFIGAQVDVSGLLQDCSGLPGLAKLVARKKEPHNKDLQDEDTDEFKELAKMFNGVELDVVRQHGGRMYREYVDVDAQDQRPRLLIKDSNDEFTAQTGDITQDPRPTGYRERLNGKLEGIYQHYLLVRPAPSHRILFTSPSLRVPGILQSSFLHRIGGSTRVRNDLAAALAEGRGVTAKIRWLTRPAEDGCDGEGRPRWIHCTPLMGHTGAVGVWMVVLVDEDDSKRLVGRSGKFKQAPPVSSNIGSHDQRDMPCNASQTLTQPLDRPDATSVNSVGAAAAAPDVPRNRQNRSSRASSIGIS